MQFKTIIISLVMFTMTPLLLAAETKEEEISFEKPLFKPFIERYVLDELKQLRQDQQALNADIEKKLADTRLNAADRAISYTTDTTNNIFYIITATASILVLLGWKSIKDIKDNIEASVSQKIFAMTLEYEKRLNEIEKKISDQVTILTNEYADRLKELEENAKERSEQILANQEEISATNQIHALWMRAGLEKSDQEKISIYDQILEHNPDDVEAMSYKADALLEIEETKWALSLSNQAIEKDSEYSFAYWQRACAYAAEGDLDAAMNDLEKALELSPVLKGEILNEKFFEHLKENERFNQIIESPPASA